jgi:ADP-ribosylarginine hydrolase
MSDKFDNYFASIYLAMIGDKIGFGNGDRERNYMSKMIEGESNQNFNSIVEGLTNMLLFRFIAEGGITGLNMENLLISDDTEMHFGTLNGLISDYKTRNELYNNITNRYLEIFKDISYMRDKLLAGRQTIEAIKSIKNGVDWRNFSYNNSAGGSGGPMRTMCIGLAFHQTTSLLKLIETTIMITSITHPNCIAFIGSIASSLFTSYALRGLNPETWIFELINLLQSDVIDGIIGKIKPLYIEYFKEDKKLFLHKLLTYVETSFSDYNYIISELNVRSIYPARRMIYYYDNFSTDKKVINPGAGADDCIIIAYDCLLMSKYNYEKLIFTSMINIGDSDTIGSIASAWYGALYGFKNISENIKEYSQYNEIRDLVKQLYDKYYDKEVN